MQIDQLLKNAAFDSDTTAVLAMALDEAWQVVLQAGSGLSENDRAPATRTILAKRILATATEGERDPRKLAADAVVYLANSNLDGSAAAG